MLRRLRSITASSSLVAVWLAFAGLLVACSSTPGTVDPGDGAPAPPYAPVTDEARALALDAVEAELYALSAGGADGYQAELAAFAEARPEFAWAAPQSNGGVLAFFTDGRALVVPPPRRTEGSAPASVSGAAAGPSAVGRSEDGSAFAATHPGLWRAGPSDPIASGDAVHAQATVAELPSSRTAVLVEAMGSHHASALATVRSSLEHAGYRVSVAAPDVATLRTLPTAGVLYYSGHGGEFLAADVDGSGLSAQGLRTPAKPEPVVAAFDDFALWTAEPWSVEGDLAHREDLEAGRLVYMTQTFDRGGVPRTHYALTTGFVTKYWSGAFSADALAFIDACFGSSPILGEALRLAGASAQIGWSGEVSDAASVLRATPYFFDRSTGANAFEPASLPNPPFESSLVLAAMATKEYDGDPRFPESTFGMRLLQGGYGMLAPRYMLTIDNFHQGGDYVYLLGQFGSVPGTVTVGGTEVTITAWTPTSVYLDFPSSLAGDVVVEVGGRSSNVRRLTSWTVPLEVTARGSGSLTLRVECDLHLRGDLMPWNPWSPDAPLYLEEMAKPFASVTGKEDSSCVYAASGTYTTSGESPVTTSYSGSGTMEKHPSQTGLPDLIDAMSIDPGHETGVLSSGFPEDRHFFTKTVNGDSTIVDLVDGMGGPCNRFAFETLRLDASYAILAGTETFTTDYGESCEATWTASAATHAPGP